MEADSCVQLRKLSLCLEARVCVVLHYTITLYSTVLYCTEGDGSGVGGGL